MDIPHDTLIEKFSESLGLDKSEQLIQKALTESGVTRSTIYQHDDVIRLLLQIRDYNSGYIKILSNILITKVRLSQTNKDISLD